MRMRPSHLQDLQAIMRGANVLEREAQDEANMAGPTKAVEKAQVLATLALSKRIEALIHCQLYSAPSSHPASKDSEDELG